MTSILEFDTRQSRPSKELSSGRMQFGIGAMAALLDTLSYGIILIGADCKPVHVNNKAQGVLDGPHGLRITQNGLVAEIHEDSLALEKLIRTAVESVRDKSQATDGALVLSTSDWGEYLHVLVSPLRSDAMGRNPREMEVCAAVFISLPGQSVRYSVGLLMSLFGLTRSEARVLGELANGKSLHEIAENLEISKNTARSYLQTLFDKTGTSRQAQLVCLVLSSPVPLLSAI